MVLSLKKSYILYIMYVCSIIYDMSSFVIEDYMLDWHSCQICYPYEIKLLLLYFFISITYSIWHGYQCNIWSSVTKVDMPSIIKQV